MEVGSAGQTVPGGARGRRVFSSRLAPFPGSPRAGAPHRLARQDLGPEVQVDRLKYGLAHGVKEGLVEKVSQWPGVHCMRALVEGETVEGYWFNRSQEHAARQRRENFDRLHYATPEVLALSPLPCWKHLSEETRRRLVADLVADIESEAAVRREQTGSQVLGVSAV